MADSNVDLRPPLKRWPEEARLALRIARSALLCTYFPRRSRRRMEAMDVTESGPTECVLPGQRLGHTGDFLAGQGTYVRKHHIFASVVGFKQIEVSRQTDNS